MLQNILVYGWYSHGNVGDELFKEAYYKLFPELNLTFTDHITPSMLDQADGVFIGGGSFLNFPLNIKPDVIAQLKSKPLFYLGVGSETDIHPMHQELIKQAILINIRNDVGLEKIKKLNKNVFVTLDLVYALSDEMISSAKIPNSVLIIPNISVIPQNKDPYWKHVSWNYFKSEFSQFIDFLIKEKCYVDFLPFCVNNNSNDQWAAYEIINHMDNHNGQSVLNPFYGIANVSRVISKYEMVITQRYHGVVISEMMGIPYISIHHHDKLKPTNKNVGKFISYYGTSKGDLIDNFKLKNNIPTLSIERDIIEELKSQILSSLL